jgi:serine/threonine protein kinase
MRRIDLNSKRYGRIHAIKIALPVFILGGILFALGYNFILTTVETIPESLTVGYMTSLILSMPIYLIISYSKSRRAKKLRTKIERTNESIKGRGLAQEKLGQIVQKYNQGDFDGLDSKIENVLEFWEREKPYIRQLLEIEKEMDQKSHQRNISAKESIQNSIKKSYELLRQQKFDEVESIINKLQTELEEMGTDKIAEKQKGGEKKQNKKKDSSKQKPSNSTVNHITQQKTSSDEHPVPEAIPSGPSISVDYNEITDESPIGGGGNADVVKAKLPTSEGNVTIAIKEPRVSGTLQMDRVERMIEEAETWEKLDDHDNIVNVVDYDSRPIPWIAMEYMDGGDLGSAEMDIPQSLWTAISVTEGVRHAHTRGVAHLDLKPDNILFRTVEDAWNVPKVADWGLSKHLLEQSNSVEGLSPHYAAPEQFEEKYGPADNVTDVYQLGAVFYELFTGQPPFEGRPSQVMRAVINKEPTPPSSIADVPKELDDILLTALAKERENRYDDILYLRDNLQELYEKW